MSAEPAITHTIHADKVSAERINTTLADMRSPSCKLSWQESPERL